MFNVSLLPLYFSRTLSAFFICNMIFYVEKLSAIKLSPDSFYISRLIRPNYSANISRERFYTLLIYIIEKPVFPIILIR